MSNDLTQRLAEIWAALDPVDEWREDIAGAIDALTAQAAQSAIDRKNIDRLAEIISQQANELEALRADAAVLTCQVGSLRDALTKVLDTRNKEAKANLSYQNARDNFSSYGHEILEHERAMLAACSAEREARTLLLTLKTTPDAAIKAGKAVTP